MNKIQELKCYIIKYTKKARLIYHLKMQYVLNLRNN